MHTKLFVWIKKNLTSSYIFKFLSSMLSHIWKKNQFPMWNHWIHFFVSTQFYMSFSQILIHTLILFLSMHAIFLYVMSFSCRVQVLMLVFKFGLYIFKNHLHQLFTNSNHGHLGHCCILQILLLMPNESHHPL